MDAPVAAEVRTYEAGSSFWIEARPWTCSKHVAPVARELGLACDAAGGSCKVASDEPSADRRIVLKCDDTKWTVETQDAKGTRLWSVDVAGDPADRARSAAVFVVRAETGERLPPPPSPPPAPPREAPATARTDVPDRAPDDGAKKIPNVTLSFASRGSLKLGDVDDRWGSKVTENGGKILGVNAGATVDIDGIRFGPTGGVGFGIEYSPRAYAESQPFFWHVGAVTALGAPFKRSMFGLALEGGFGRLILEHAAHDFGYLRPSFVVQPAPRSEVRPFIAAAYELKGGGITGHLVGIDLGMAWDL